MLLYQDEASSGHQGREFRRIASAAKSVYARGGANGKRMQCMGGAKNHGVILPNADLDLD